MSKSFEVPPSLPEHSRPRYRSSRSTKGKHEMASAYMHGSSFAAENDILASSRSLPNHRRGGAVVSTVGSRTLVGSRPATLRPKSYTRPLGESRSEVSYIEEFNHLCPVHLTFAQNHAVGMSSSNSSVSALVLAPDLYNPSSIIMYSEANNVTMRTAGSQSRTLYAAVTVFHL